MLYNKKTVVALTAACLFALNDATQLEQCCDDDAQGGDDNLQLVSDAMVEEIAKVTADLRALQQEFAQYQMDAQASLEMLQNDVQAMPLHFAEDIQSHSTLINQLTENQRVLDESQELAVDGLKGLETTLNQKVDQQIAASQATAEELARIEGDLNAKVQAILDDDSPGGVDPLMDERVIALENSLRELEGDHVTWEAYYTNHAAFNCQPYDWKTFTSFSVPAGETLECSIGFSTNWEISQNRFFMVGVFQNEELQGIAIDDSWSKEEKDAAIDGFEDNAAVSMFYKGSPSATSTYAVKIHGGHEGCNIPWTQAQVSCKTYGHGHTPLELNIVQD